MPDIDATVALCARRVNNLVRANAARAAFAVRIEYTCGTCDAPFSRLARRDRGSARHFCSAACRAKAGHSAWNKGAVAVVAKLCEACGEWMRGKRSVLRRRRFCSMTCFGHHHAGQGHPFWRGGTTTQRQAVFNSAEYREWAAAVRARDGGRCRSCDASGRRNSSRIELHHIIPFSISQDLAFAVDNGITLCREHHNKTRGREHEFAAVFALLIGAPLLADPSPNRKDRTPLSVSRDDMLRLYVTLKKPTTEIARIYGVTSTCVQQAMKRMGIARRSMKEAHAVRIGAAHA